MTDQAKPQYFHFTLGPVQGFVAQARRTRDFWAGSFILSWLAAVAMKATTAQGAIIKFPAVDDNFMYWLTDDEDKDIKKKPIQGCVPHQFKAEVPTDIDFKPDDVIQAVLIAWKALADKVWQNDLSSIAKQENQAIWDRQISAFWDMVWVLEPNNDSTAISTRKNWRTYAATNEGGVKCTMMEGWQELSGVPTPNRKDLNDFWDKVIENGKLGMKNDLAKNETLCAIAFVKRRFSRYFGDINCPMPQGWKLKGWKLSSNVPSVTYMAAVHWLHDLVKNADLNVLNTYQDAAYSISEQDERSTILPILSKDETIGLGQRAIEFNKLLSSDGNVFFSTMLENKNLFKDINTKPTLAALKAATANVKLKKQKFQDATPFYAILLMDGDSLGKHMSRPDQQKQRQSSITKGLAEFTGQVPDIVKSENGFLVYAGGDDVLAILPLENAISCSMKLRNCYLSCFTKKQDDSERINVDMTISAAIEFAHIKMPLTQVLKDAHNLLDEVAKEQTGRDALAIRVWKGGGLQIEWSQPWEIALIPEKDKTYLEQLTQEFQTINEKDDQFSNKFFYKVRERFSLLNPLDKKDCELRCHDANKEQMEMATNLLAVDYLNSGKTKISELKNAQERIDKAKDAIRPLLNQCVSVKRTAEKEPKDWEYNSCLKADAALLVRFLAQKGVETR
jgi:CRISPR-associated protein Cmr2